MQPVLNKREELCEMAMRLFIAHGYDETPLSRTASQPVGSVGIMFVVESFIINSRKKGKFLKDGRI
jgi:hypothetical protein